MQKEDYRLQSLLRQLSPDKPAGSFRGQPPRARQKTLLWYMLHYFFDSPEKPIGTKTNSYYDLPDTHNEWFNIPPIRALQREVYALSQ
jgi:hypothetical protein